MRRSSGVSNLNQLPRRRARHFLEQRRAIVRRHLVENGGDLFVRHAAEQFLLRIHVEVFKNVRRQCRRQNAEDDDAIVCRQIENHFRYVGSSASPGKFHANQQSCAPLSGCGFRESISCRP